MVGDWIGGLFYLQQEKQQIEYLALKLTIFRSCNNQITKNEQGYCGDQNK
jgi:hypothetical protein